MTGKSLQLYDTTHPDWAPSQKLGYTTDLPLGQDRHEMAACRLAIKLEAESKIDDPIYSADDNLSDTDNGISVQQSYITSSDIMRIEEDNNAVSAKEKEMEERVISLQKEIKELRKGSTLDEDWFRDEDDRVCYYTGLGSW